MFKQLVLAIAILSAWGLSALGYMELTEITHQRVCAVYQTYQGSPC